LVTGANRGIGSCFVAELLAAGADRVYAGARSAEGIASLEAIGDPRVVPLQLDVTSAADIEAVVAACEDIDLLVSNAGRRGTGPVLEFSESELRDLFEVHAIGPWKLVRGFAPALRTRGGGVIWVHSIAAMSMSRGGPQYSASKAAGMMLGMGIFEALRADGVRVTNVYPGFTDTENIAEFDIHKADPRETARRSLAGWTDGSLHVFPDDYAELVHERMRVDLDSFWDEPVATGSACIAAYRADHP